MSSMIETKPAKHNRFYCDNVVFQVENALFKVPRYKFKLLSPVFSDMFASPKAEATSSEEISTQEGECDENPIVLDGYTCQDFERLLSVMFTSEGAVVGDPVPLSTREEWVSVLKLSTVWEMKKIRGIALGELAKMPISNLERVALAKEYRVASWFKEAIAAIATSATLAEGASLEEMAGAVGWETAARILWFISSRNLNVAPDTKEIPTSGDITVDLKDLHCTKDPCLGFCGLSHSRRPTATPTSPPSWNPMSLLVNEDQPQPFPETSFEEYRVGTSNIRVEVPAGQVDIEWSLLRSQVGKAFRPTLSPDAIEKEFEEELKALEY